MHGRRGNYMLCKWKRKKGGCHGQLSRGREGKGGWILYRGDAHTTENVNSFVFLVTILSLSLSGFFIYIYSRLSPFYIYLFFSYVLFIFLILSLIDLSSSLCLVFFCFFVLLDFMRRRELMRNGRTELIFRAGEKQKARLSSLEFYRVLAITPAKRGSRRSFCKRLLNIQTWIVGTICDNAGMFVHWWKCWRYP